MMLSPSQESQVSTTRVYDELLIVSEAKINLIFRTKTSVIIIYNSILFDIQARKLQRINELDNYFRDMNPIYQPRINIIDICFIVYFQIGKRLSLIQS